MKRKNDNIMKSYYDDKKYYSSRAMKIAKKANNVEAIELLKMLLKNGNIYPIDFIKEVNEMNIAKVDLFNIESKNEIL